MIQVRDIVGLSQVSALYVRDNIGLSKIGEVRVRDVIGLSTVYLAGTAQGSLQPDYVSGFGYSTHLITVNTDNASVANPPSGASFVWTFADSGWSAVSPTSATSQFRKTVSPGNTETTTVYCTVTINGRSYNTNTITAEVSNAAEGN